MRFFSTKNREAWLGPYPLERLKRTSQSPDFESAPSFQPLSFKRRAPQSIVNAMGEFQAMLDAIRVGLTNKQLAGCPDDPLERARHLKAFGYFCDASMVGVCQIPKLARLAEPFRNPDVDRLAGDLKTRQTKTLASGIDMIMADLRESMEAPATSIDSHTHALIFLYEYPA